MQTLKAIPKTLTIAESCIARRLQNDRTQTEFSFANANFKFQISYDINRSEQSRLGLSSLIVRNLREKEKKIWILSNPSFGFRVCRYYSQIAMNRKFLADASIAVREHKSGLTQFTANPSTAIGVKK